ncbi:MscL family protein [Streptomyces virginiae]|uniref:MscL family protein n=1 Tax=Streptomyces virginiae TaxID=1961 RepID=UPI0033B5D428
MSHKAFTVGATQFPYGALINVAISFLLLATALYFLVVLPINKLHERLAPHQDVQAPKRDSAVARVSRSFVTHRRWAPSSHVRRRSLGLIHLEPEYACQIQVPRARPPSRK